MKKFSELVIYIIGPMEDDPKAEASFNSLARVLRLAGVKAVINPCEEEVKKNRCVCAMDAQKSIGVLRKLGKHNKVDTIYKNIWAIDTDNVRRADILVTQMNLKKKHEEHYQSKGPCSPTSGTTTEAVLANLVNFLDLVVPRMSRVLQTVYRVVVRHWLLCAGWQKPVYLITNNKTRINGTYVYRLVRGSGGKVFKTHNELIQHLKRVYQ